MRRREFIAGLGSAAAWPVVPSAEPLPVMGYINTGAGNDAENRLLTPFKLGLAETGFVVAGNVAIEIQRVSNLNNLPSAVANLIQKKVAVIYGATTACIAAKRVTTAIPIVFVGDGDPVADGLVESFNHPGGNVTGVRLTAGDLPLKLLEMLHELVPGVGTVGLLINPQFANAEAEAAHTVAAARALDINAIVVRTTDAAKHRGCVRAAR
jgi:putative tryptophan/tyrosine transport system substrate-binding protein